MKDSVQIRLNHWSIIFFFGNIALINIIQLLLYYYLSPSRSLLQLRHDIRDLRKENFYSKSVFLHKFNPDGGKSLNNTETFFNEIDFRCNSVSD